jgi:predicted nucleic acid-binding protein
VESGSFVILCDTGPIVTILVEDDHNHKSCTEAMKHMPPKALVTTWPCMVEAMHILRREDAAHGQDLLWRWLDVGLIKVAFPADGDLKRMRELMHKYRDLPMDFADASLVAAAERLNIKRIFTIDSHFRIYKFKGKHSFEVIP